MKTTTTGRSRYEGYRALGWAVLIASVIRWGFLENYVIPSSSMEHTLLQGDYLVVSKIHYGPRFPMTPCQIPLTHQHIWGTSWSAYWGGIRLPYFRFPGFAKIQRGDKVVYNGPMDLKHPVDLKTYYIKRCVGLPGDHIEVVQGQVYIDGRQQLHYPGLQYAYFVTGKNPLSSTFFAEQDIREYFPVPGGGYQVLMTSAMAAQLRDMPMITEVQPLFRNKGQGNKDILGFDHENHWNRDYFGPFWVPKSGMSVPINVKTLRHYGSLIQLFEGHQDVCIDTVQGVLKIADKTLKTYTFRRNYYFMMGDNRPNSRDTRFASMGLVPEDHVLGKAVLVLFSWDASQHFLRKIRWRRICTWIGGVNS